MVTLSGELDMATAVGLSDWLIEISGSEVIVDLADLTFMDSSGITELVLARNRLIENGDELILTRPAPIVRRALEVVGLAGWITDWDAAWDVTHD
jgi:anti-sigma B factor antagonist